MGDSCLATALHPLASDHLPGFLTAPGETDVLFVVAACSTIGLVLAFGILFLRLHTLPERMAHKAHKLQFEIVAVLGLLALFTHVHLFWVAGLLLAFIDIPDFVTPLKRMAGALEKLAGIEAQGEVAEEGMGPAGPAGHAIGGHAVEAASAHPAAKQEH